ncbi:hypothetical protein ACFX5K_04525 [Rickettsiales bacterium LUAb2]
MNSKVIFNNLIKVLSVVTVVLLLQLTNKVQAEILPNLYVSGAMVSGNGGLKNIKLENNTDNFSVNKVDNQNNGFMFAAGISPNLPIPIIGSLRGQFEYSRNFNNNARGNMYGVGVYYDVLKIIPIVTPYIGASFMYYQANTRFELSGNDGKSVSLFDKVNQPLAAFTVGANFDIPFIPLQVFAEYKYITSSVFSSNIKVINDNNISVKSADFKSNSIVLGLKYNII